MNKYFNNENARDTDNADIFMFMRQADKQPEDFIRIAVDDEVMHLDYKGEQEYDLYEAVVFLWSHPGEVMRYDFDCEDDDKYLYLAIDEKNGLAFRIDDSEYNMEGINTFGMNEGLFGIFRADEGTIFITYDGTMEKIGYSFLEETPDSPQVADQMEMLFDMIYEGKEAAENNPEAEDNIQE